MRVARGGGRWTAWGRLASLVVATAACVVVARAWIGADPPRVPPVDEVGGGAPPPPTTTVERGALAPGAIRTPAGSFEAPLCASALAREAVLRGCVVDAAGRPFAGASLRCEPVDGAAPIQASTDGAGKYELCVPLRDRDESRVAWLCAEARGCVPARRRCTLVAGAIDCEPIVLASGCIVQGHVVDAAGAGCAGVEVLAAPASSALLRALAPPDAKAPGGAGAAPGKRLHAVSADARTTSVADGRFELPALPPGRHVVFAGSDPSSASARLGTAHAVVELRLSDPPAEVTLVLVDPATSIEIAGVVVGPDGIGRRARVRWSRAGARPAAGMVATDDEGRFRFAPAELVAHDLEALDPSSRLEAGMLDGVLPGSQGIQLAMTVPERLALAVTDPGGAPIESFFAFAQDPARMALVGSLALTSASEVDAWRLVLTRCRGDSAWDPGYVYMTTGVHAAGRAKLPVPSRAFSVVVGAAGCGRVVLGPFLPEHLPATPVEVVLVRLATVSGRVVTVGRPVAGAQVRLHREACPRCWVGVDGFRTRAWPRASAHGRTDADGRFELPVGESGSYWLQVQADGFALGEAGPLALDPGRARAGVEVELIAGGSIEGQVVAAADEIGSVVTIAVAASRGDGAPIAVPVGPDGRFHFEHLTPGPWELRSLAGAAVDLTGSICSAPFFEHYVLLEHAASDPPPRPFRWSCTVTDGAVTRHDVQLRPTPCVLAGVFSWIGASGAEAAVTTDGVELEPHAVNAPDFEPLRVELLGDGAFEVAVAEIGEYELLVRGESPRGCRWTLRDVVALAPGTSTWRPELAPARITGSLTCEPGHAGGSLVFEWSGAGALRFEASVRPGAADEFDFPRVPAGPARLLYTVRDEVLASWPVETTAGEALTLELAVERP